MKTNKKEDAKTLATFAKKSHAENRHIVLEGLFNRSMNKLIDDFFVEMDAKNTAYYFILENGYFEAFQKYCKENQKK